MAMTQEDLMRHRRIIPHQSLDTILSSSLPHSPRPSTASLQTSFQSAFSSLESSPSNYCLPDLSASTAPVYTKSDAYAYTPSFGQGSGGVGIGQVGRIWLYVPGESSEEVDVYIEENTQAVTGTADFFKAKDEVQTPSEQKVLGAWKDLVLARQPPPEGAESPMEVIELIDLPYQPMISVTDEVKISVCNNTAGEVMGSRTDVGEMEVKQTRRRLSKKQHRQSHSRMYISQKVEKMLLKLRLSRTEE